METDENGKLGVGRRRKSDAQREIRAREQLEGIYITVHDLRHPRPFKSGHWFIPQN